jgi:predicted DNA-binding transcriptional regulator YafY
LLQESLHCWSEGVFDPQTSPAVKLVESALREHHRLQLVYITAAGVTRHLTVEPLAIRYNSAHHLVLWVRDVDAGHLEELLLSGIEDAVDTGETFEPPPRQA